MQSNLTTAASRLTTTTERFLMQVRGKHFLFCFLSFDIFFSLPASESIIDSRSAGCRRICFGIDQYSQHDISNSNQQQIKKTNKNISNHSHNKSRAFGQLGPQKSWTEARFQEQAQEQQQQQQSTAACRNNSV